MTRQLQAASVAAILSVAGLLSSCASVGTAQQRATPGPRTRAELTNYRETSLHADVVAFVDSLKALKAPIVVRGCFIAHILSRGSRG